MKINTYTHLILKTELDSEYSDELNCPDRAFHSILTRKFNTQRVLLTTETPIDGFQDLKIAKSSVGLALNFQTPNSQVSLFPFSRLV